MADDLRPKEGIILCGGKGTRLSSVLQDIPKPLAEVSGRPFLDYLLFQLMGWNIRHIILSIGHLGERIEARYARHTHDVEISYANERSPLGTGGAIGLSAASLKDGNAPEPVIVMNGDSYCQVDFAAAAASHARSGLPVTMVLAEVQDVARYGAVELDENNRIIRFDEKGARTGPGLINAGIYVIAPDLLRKIPKEQFLSFEYDILPTWIDAGINGFVSKGIFIDIGTPDSLLEAQAVFERFPAP